MAKHFYRCENEYSADPCEFATNDHRISEEEVDASIDGGNPKCPGKTKSGKVCGSKLVLIGGSRPSRAGGIAGMSKVLLAGGGLVLVLLLTSLIVVPWFGGNPSDEPRDPVIEKHDPLAVDRDPWWVLDELEATSKILTVEP